MTFVNYGIYSFTFNNRTIGPKTLVKFKGSE